ncbi:unnamed protein product [Closterium sp. NIES-64]|nr:unnamed protein product [Closterium sp. NIES-64]
MEDRCVCYTETACNGDMGAEVAEYERFVEERLKVDFQAAMEDSEELVRNIEALEENGVEEMRAMVNLGGDVFVQADVPDTSHIFVAVGLGFHVEFTRLEAKEFAASKVEHLRNPQTPLLIVERTSNPLPSPSPLTQFPSPYPFLP